VPELDRYVKGIQDLLSQLGSPAERISAMEQAAARLMPQGDTRRAAGELISGLMSTPERMRDLQKTLTEFSQPAKQLREFEEQLKTTRQQLLLMAKQLEGAETAIGRIADLAERLAAFQEPWLNAAAAWRGTDTRRDQGGTGSSGSGGSTGSGGASSSSGSTGSSGTGAGTGP